MHPTKTVRLGCTDCHGGNATIFLSKGIKKDSKDYNETKDKAHPHPTYPEKWKSSANPERPYTLTLKENLEWIRFVNPGDFRVTHLTCGQCHTSETYNSQRSTMTTTPLLWGSAAYNNGIVSPKNYLLGESYDENGKARVLTTDPKPTQEDLKKGVIPVVVPMPRWNITQPAERHVRSFERGGRLSRINPGEIGNPNLQELDEPGRPDMKLSDRGLGTQLRISSPVLNVHKTRLNDPHLSFMGTNDHPGDYRSSGCTACHVVYSNDRDPEHSGPYAQYGHDGTSFSKDKTIPKNESGHPIRHQLTRAIPSSQCMVCHMHQPNAFENTYYGYQMWDYESDGEGFYPKKQQKLSAAKRKEVMEANPEGAVIHGLWHDKAFLKKVWEKNPYYKRTQFADYHGHGWNFRAVFKKDREGNLLDAQGKQVSDHDPKKWKKAIHLKDIHLEKGMHCVDCHFAQDVHGNGKLYGAYQDEVTVTCVDCHGNVRERAQLKATGPAGGFSFENSTTPFGKKRFTWRGNQLYQRSALHEGKEWPVPQVIDTITPGNPHFNAKARRAKVVKNLQGQLAHDDSTMTCYACHTSWVTNCFGCHLPQRANEERVMKHYEGELSRNWTSYNPQVLRDEGYMLGKWGPSKGGKIAPVRSSSALMISSMNANREQIYFEQAPISTPGFSSQAFNPHYPHAVRKTESKTCDDCHVSVKNDNNAWLAQVLLLGTNTVNFLGRYAYVGTEGGFDAVKVTETDEPQAVIGSFLESLAYPKNYQNHLKNKKKLTEGYHHHGGEVGCLQLRGEYLYVAEGEEGFRAYDVANVDNKGFSERLVTAPVSPWGQQTRIKLKHATCVALPTNMPIDPTRKVIAENQEQPWHPLYHYAFVTDSEEGLILVNVDTLADGNPRNNYLKRALTYNPNGLLKGARYVTNAGNYLYITSDAGLIILNIDTPLKPRVVKVISDFKNPHVVAIQFRYAFVTDDQGLKVVDITDPEKPMLVKKAFVPLKNIHDLYVARTYAYVAAGKEGLVIVDVKIPTSPKIQQRFTANHKINDARAVRVAATNASFFAYVADGKNGLHVIQLTSPKTQDYYGFSPLPRPELIATYKTKNPALSLSKGMDRDRAVDESGNQVSVFGRLGSRPFTLEEMKKMYLQKGKVYKVRD
ncbi:MAG: hypothetical protein IPJ69_06590 [Deltaproteobacteria bacterium]|nr:MAG: hypothetical protein IPJ69_06590 [Deltaproteobacteria bacterium]